MTSSRSFRRRNKSSSRQNLELMMSFQSVWTNACSGPISSVGVRRDATRTRAHRVSFLRVRPCRRVRTSDRTSPTAGIGDSPSCRVRGGGFRPDIDALSNTFGCFNLHLVKHGAPEGLQRPVGSRRDRLWRVSRVIPLPCDRVVRRVRSSAPATGSDLRAVPDCTCTTTPPPRDRGSSR